VGRRPKQTPRADPLRPSVIRLIALHSPREAARFLIARTHPPPLHVPPKSEVLGVDDARLLPHLRKRTRLEERTRLEHQQAAIFRNQHAEALAQGRDTSKPNRSTAGGDKRKLRGIPVQARGVGSVQPGTQPEQQATRGQDDTPSDVMTFLLHANARRRAA
jgi:hypothetical protein